jgi:hypothetical protein
MYLEFEPHSWYMSAAIQKDNIGENWNGTLLTIWRAYLENGMNYTIVEFSAKTLKELKEQIKEWHIIENERIERLYEGVK